MKNYIIERDTALTDLTPLFVGEQRCAPSHSFGPYVRDYYLIHVCLSGKGILRDRYGTHLISAGELFIIRKSEVTVYTADRRDPWHYIWIAFDGALCKKIFELGSVHSVSGELSEGLFKLISDGKTEPYAYTAWLYGLFSEILPYKKQSPDTLSLIKEYIEYNYMEGITVEGLSEKFRFDRSHLYRVFKKRYGIGIKSFITETRMKRAKEFLSEGMSVADTAHLVGYTDEFNFSRAFSKYVGAPPSTFKQK